MRFHRRLSGFILVLAAAGALGADAAGRLLEGKAVAKGGVSIRLPAGWQLDDHASSRTILLARAPGPDKDETGEFQTLLTVSSDAGTKIDGAAQQARVAKDFANYKPLEEPTAINIDGLEGVKFGGTLTLGSLKLRTRQYMVLRDNKIYTCTFMALESHWASYAAAMEASVATFHVVEK